MTVSRRQSPGADDLSLSVEMFSFRLLQTERPSEFSWTPIKFRDSRGAV